MKKRLFNWMITMVVALIMIIGSGVSVFGIEAEGDLFWSWKVPVEDDGSEGAANWFTQMGSLEMIPEMQFPEGKYNIDSSLGSIYNNQDAWNMLVELMKLHLLFVTIKFI